MTLYLDLVLVCALFIFMNPISFLVALIKKKEEKENLNPCEEGT